MSKFETILFKAFSKVLLVLAAISLGLALLCGFFASLGIEGYREPGMIAIVLVIFNGIMSLYIGHEARKGEYN